MTTRRRRAAPRGRVARLVWINTEVEKSLTSTGGQVTDMLTNAGNLKHDATILRVIGQLNINGTRILATTASFELDMGLWVGDESATFATGPDPQVDSDEAAWLWRFKHFSLHQGDGTLTTASGLLNRNMDVDVKAKRRFRENSQTLWFRLQVTNAGLNVIAGLNFKVRTLLRVP